MITPKDAVKLKRQALRWTIEKLAAELGRSPQEIHKLESGSLHDGKLLDEIGALLDKEIANALPLWERVLSDPDLMSDSASARAVRKVKLVAFGKLLRDRREKAKLSRMTLAKLARLSDSSIKFIETARHPPSRRTCQALVAVPDLGLKWEDVATLDYIGKEPLSIAPESEMAAPGDSPVARAQSAETVHPNTSATTARPSDCDEEVIEEEITTRIRRVIRRK